MSSTEPNAHWQHGGDDPLPAHEQALYPSRDHDLRVSYDDGLVQHSVPQAPPPRRARSFGRFILFLILIAVAWSAWAVAAFYDFTVGLNRGDPVALERRIDWASVRQALRDDLQAGAISAAAEPSIDALVSERAITNLLRTAKLKERGWETAAQTTDDATTGFDWHRIRYAFFSGSPFTLRIDVRPDGATSLKPVVLLFRWTGDWRLVRVFLPEQEQASPVAAQDERPPAAQSIMTSAVTSTPLGAEHATLYEEDGKGPPSKGKLFRGTVTWNTERLPPVTGGVSGLAVVGHVAIPERQMTVTLAIRRNLDRALPASHMVEINFDLPPQSPTQGVQEMAGVMMKPTEEAPGQNLAGTRVKVRDGVFLFALSAIDLDVQHNMGILKDRAWLGIPFRYGNGNRAVLVIEKGASGERTLAEGIAQWGTTAAAGAASDKKP